MVTKEEHVLLSKKCMVNTEQVNMETGKKKTLFVTEVIQIVIPILS